MPDNSENRDRQLLDRWKNTSRTRGNEYVESMKLGKRFLIAGISGGFAAGVGLILAMQHDVPPSAAALSVAVINGIFGVIAAVIQSKKG